MKKIGLSQLLFPTSAQEFLINSWPQEVFVAHQKKSTEAASGALNEVLELPFLQSLKALLDVWPRSVQAHLPKVADESSSIQVSPKDAEILFNQQMGLLFNNAHTLSPILEDWLKSIAQDLGLPRSTIARCIVYATPDGKGTAAHFDQNINFVVQLYGTKKWWLAPNENVENPTERFTIGQELDPELASYSALPMPSEMPANAQEIILKPGSVLFVPRGYWHRTEAEGEALALNFTYSQPSWVDILTIALKSRLNLSPEWRALADGVNSREESRREQAKITFEVLLQELIDDLPHWEASDILAATEGE